jgi:KUP system potassium uptake protein
MEIRQTSDKARGQIYAPFTNWTLYLAVIYLVLNFQSSSNLAAAYGIAVTGTMTIDTLLIAFMIFLAWRWSYWIAIPLVVFLLWLDISYFAANAIKIPQGGWFPLLIAALSFASLMTWRKGRQLLFAEIARLEVPIDALIGSTDGIPRVTGAAIFLTTAGNGAPSSLLHNLKHNQVLHEQNVLMTVRVEDRPYVPNRERMQVTDLGRGFYRIYLKYGFMETPDIPAALDLCSLHNLHFDMATTTFFISRALVIPRTKPGMAMWRVRLYLAMTKNAMNAADFFKIPPNRVIEMGTKIEI